MNKDSEVTFTYTSILHDKKGEKLVRVCFERQGKAGREFAEGILPQGTIETSFGFSDEEVAEMEAYLKDNGADIMLQARKITGITHWLS